MHKLKSQKRCFVGLRRRNGGLSFPVLLGREWLFPLSCMFLQLCVRHTATMAESWQWLYSTRPSSYSTLLRVSKWAASRVAAILTQHKSPTMTTSLLTGLQKKGESHFNCRIRFSKPIEALLAFSKAIVYLYFVDCREYYFIVCRFFFIPTIKPMKTIKPPFVNSCHERCHSSGRLQIVLKFVAVHLGWENWKMLKFHTKWPIFLYYYKWQNWIKSLHSQHSTCVGVGRSVKLQLVCLAFESKL